MVLNFIRMSIKDQVNCTSFFFAFEPYNSLCLSFLIIYDRDIIETGHFFAWSAGPILKIVGKHK